MSKVKIIIKKILSDIGRVLLGIVITAIILAMLILVFYIVQLVNSPHFGFENTILLIGGLIFYSIPLAILILILVAIITAIDHSKQKHEAMVQQAVTQQHQDLILKNEHFNINRVLITDPKIYIDDINRTFAVLPEIGDVLFFKYQDIIDFHAVKSPELMIKVNLRNLAIPYIMLSVLNDNQLFHQTLSCLTYMVGSTRNLM